MNIFLKIKPLQLFLLSWGPLVVSLITLFGFPDYFLYYLPLTLVFFLIGAFNSFAWFYSIVQGLKNKLNEKMAWWMYYVSFWVPTGFFLAFTIFLLYNVFIQKVKSYDLELELKILSGLAVLSIACVVYGIFFTAKMIKSVELKRTSNLKDYFLDFVLLIFAPIGMWIIQPRLNMLVNSEKLQHQD